MPARARPADVRRLLFGAGVAQRITALHRFSSGRVGRRWNAWVSPADLPVAHLVGERSGVAKVGHTDPAIDTQIEF